METQSLQAAETIVGDEPDFYRATWERSTLPGPTKFRLENVDRRANAFLVISEMLAAHVRGKVDEQDNEGVRYSWLSDRQAGALFDALHDLANEACKDMERVRQDFILKGEA